MAPGPKRVRKRHALFDEDEVSDTERNICPYREKPNSTGIIPLKALLRLSPSATHGIKYNTEAIVTNITHETVSPIQITHVELFEFPSVKINGFIIAKNDRKHVRNTPKFRDKHILRDVSLVYPINGNVRLPVLKIPSFDSMEFVKSIDTISICAYTQEKCTNVVDITKSRLCFDHITKELIKKNLHRPEITSITSWNTEKNKLTKVSPLDQSCSSVINRDHTYNIGQQCLVTLFSTGRVKYTFKNELSIKKAAIKNTAIGEKIVSSSTSFSSRHLAKVLNIKKENKDDGSESVFSTTSIKIIGFNPAKNSRYIETSDTSVTASLPASNFKKIIGIKKIPLSHLNSTDIVELTDDEDE